MCEVIHLHTASDIRLYESEAIRKRECELRDRIRTGFGNVISRDGNRIEVANLIGREIFLYIAH